MKKLFLLRISLFTVAVFFFAQCEKEPVTPVEHHLVLSPDTIMLNDQEVKKVHLSVQPAGAFTWNISAKSSWIILSDTAGTIDQGVNEINVSIDFESLDPGKYAGDVEIISNGAGTTGFHIIACVNAHPKVELIPESLHYAEGQTVKSLTVKNIGSGFLDWSIESLSPWLQFTVMGGMLDSAESRQFSAYINRSGLPVGTVEGSARLTSNASNNNIIIPVTVEVVPELKLRSSVNALEFDYFENQVSFNLINDGNIPVEWDLSAEHTFLTGNPSSGIIPAGGNVEVLANINRTGLLTQQYESSVTISYNEGNTIVIPATIQHFNEELIPLGGQVADAAYDRVNDMLLFITTDPNQLGRMNTTNGQISTISLPFLPKAISISQDGATAVIGYDNGFTHYNIAGLSVIEHYAITTDVYDIAIAPNNWVYIIPETDQWVQVRCISLATGNETANTGGSIRAGSDLLLHSSGDYIYVADNDVSPSDVEKFDIRNGTAELLYDSPYHGQYAFYGGLWMSDTGHRLFAKSRNLFNLSTIQSVDLTYNNVLVGEGRIATLDYSSAADKIYTIFRPVDPGPQPQGEVRRYNTEFYAFEGTTPLPDFLIPDGAGGGTINDARGYFGFFNAAGNQYFVIVKTTEFPGNVHQWAVATITVE